MMASLYQRGFVALASFFTLWFSKMLGCAFFHYPLGAVKILTFKASGYLGR